MKDFDALFVKELRDVYDAEKQMSKVLPELAKGAHSQDLKDAIQKHLRETKEQIKRLDEISSELGEEITGHSNLVMKSMLSEAQKFLKSNSPSTIRDAALITALQQIEHYEIATYGSLKAYAKHLKLSHIHNILDDTCQEEGSMNKTLTHVAEGNVFHKGVNDKAVEKVA